MGRWFSTGTSVWRCGLGSATWEIAAALCSVSGVFLIARQNRWGWPLGIAWAGISAYLAFAEWQLVSDGILYASYIPIQIYCWAVWVRRGAATEEKAFAPTWLPRPAQGLLALAAAAGIALWGLAISSMADRVAWIPEPALLWRDSTTTVLNYFSQFLQARKRMENWAGWLIVNALGIHIYWVKGSPIYSMQYAIFLVLGLYGWWKWNQSVGAAPAEAAA